MLGNFFTNSTWHNRTRPDSLEFPVQVIDFINQEKSVSPISGDELRNLGILQLYA
jgi:hypothetical protein